MGKQTYKHPRQYTTESFKKRLRELYGDKFGLDLVEYNGACGEITLICPIHGPFITKAYYATTGHAVCKKCSNLQKSINSRIPFTEIIEKILSKHDNLTIDPNQEYKNTHTKIKVVCKYHGEFEMTPNSLLSGQNCPKCGKESMKIKISRNLDWLISESKKIHGDKYSFEKFIFKNTKTKGIVTCKKHGDFVITPEKLIYTKRGCPHCSESILESSMKNILKENKISFKQGYKAKWLGRQHLDFYLEDYNIGIECQGRQHYEPVRFGGMSEEDALKNFKYTNELDKRKKMLCEKNHVKLLYVKYDEDIVTFYKDNIDKYIN